MSDTSAAEVTLWKIVADFTRQNADRDIQVAALTAKLDAVARLEADFVKLDERVDQLVEKAGQQARFALSEAHLDALSKLADVIKRRGSLDILTEEEMMQVRAALRDLKATRETQADVRRRLSLVEEYKDHHEVEAAARMQRMSELSVRLDEQSAEHDEMSARLAVHAERLFKLEFGRIEEDEARRLRTALQHWEAFFTDYYQSIVVMMEAYRHRSEQQRDWRQWLRQTFVDKLTTALILLPLGALLGIAVRHFFGG